jgi:type I restriction enzyme R subunit
VWKLLGHFLVRPHRRSVEKFVERSAWNSLQPSDYLEVHEHLTRLPVPDEDDEFARRFDLLMLNLQLALLKMAKEAVKLIREVREIAAGLEEKRAIPAVFAQLPLIQELQGDSYWQGVTVAMLETARRDLRSLVKFLDLTTRNQIIITDLPDTLGTVSEVALVPPDYLRDYRLKVERFVREHQNHVTIQRLKLNQPITASDIQAFEDILFAADGPGSRQDFIVTFGTDQPLGKLVREIVGLDRNAAKEAFADFLSAGNLTADQITFIDQIIDHLAHNGIMDPQRLFDPPFTDRHDQGVQGVLGDRAPVILQVIEKINKNALVA